MIIDRPRIKLKLPAGVTVSKELNNLGKIADKYRTRSIKGEDQFNFAIRLEINPEKIEIDNLNFEAILFDGEESIADTQMVVPLKSYQEYVSSKNNPIVQSVVQQFQSTVTNEKIIEQMSQGSFELMKKILVEEVEGMRKVKDVFEEQIKLVKQQIWETEKLSRMKQELSSFNRDFFGKENALLIS